MWTTTEDIEVRHCENNSRAVQQVLTACRELRSPYIVLTNTMSERPLRRLLVPVSRLEEETYKAEICTYLARKSGAQIILLKANDYGSRAEQNVQKIITHISNVSQSTGTDIYYEVQNAHKNSDKVNLEAAERHQDFSADLLLITASRDYGLDDILFGPVERKVIQRSTIPVMLVNPREDLFSLCD